MTQSIKPQSKDTQTGDRKPKGAASTALQPISGSHKASKLTQRDRKAASVTSTGSPLLDSFTRNTEDPIFIPNYDLIGGYKGGVLPLVGSQIPPLNVQVPTEKDQSEKDQNGNGQKSKAKKFDTEDFKRAGLASSSRPIQKSTQAIQLKTADKSKSNAATERPTKRPAAKASGKAPSKASDRQTQAAADAVQKAAARAKKHNPTRPLARQTPQPVPPNQSSPRKSAQGPQVFSGADYKSLQSRAAAGGLVDLEDTLLFGGTENPSTVSPLSNAPAGAHNSLGEMLEYLSTQPSNFKLTKPEGNKAILDDFSYLKRPKLMETLAVIDARNFRVIEPQAEKRTSITSKQTDANELKGLTQKINQLNKKIEFLSEKLATLDGNPQPEKSAVNKAVRPDHPGAEISSTTVLDSRHFSLDL
ncbi:MAG: hypothetical protein AAF171_13715 [Cyanobacteria bacterium P01_A01_bin.116]